jgi:hypothetical protein
MIVKPATIAKEAKQLGITIPLISSHGSANGKFLERYPLMTYPIEP